VKRPNVGLQEGVPRGCIRARHAPVLLGQGRRLFDVLPGLVELEIVRVIDTPAATHIRYRIRR